MLKINYTIYNKMSKLTSKIYINNWIKTFQI